MDRRDFLKFGLAIVAVAVLPAVAGTWHSQKYYAANRATLTAAIKRHWREYGDHWTGKPHEQALIYKVTKRCRDGAVRLLYATDTSGLMSTVFFHGCRKDAPLTAVIMESTGNPVQKFGGMNISHSTASTVNDIFTTYLKPGKGHYMPPPGQPVYLTHIGYYEWGQRTFDDKLPPGLKLAHDGLEVFFKPVNVMPQKWSGGSVAV